jgi:hypothetical protein
MPIVESKLRSGTLELGTAPGTDYACQVTAIALVTSNSEEDGVETLGCGKTAPEITQNPGARVHSSSRTGTKTAGIVEWSWTNNLTEQDFLWTPNASAVTFAGVVKVTRIDPGGDVGVRITSDVSWTVVGDVTPTGAARRPSPADAVDVDETVAA